MKHTTAFVCLFLFASGALAAAPAATNSTVGATEAGRPRGFGAGAIIGSPTGLSMKYWLTDMTAIDGALAWHFGDDDRFQIHADHLWHIFVNDLHVPDARLPLYFGVGLRVLAGNHPEAGVRIPLGLSYLANRVPVEVFAEIAPVVEFAPDTDGSVEGGIGVRFYFR